MQLLLNGRQVSVDAAPGESLLQVLRERCGLRAMKDGCAPEGSCGACTVIVDGRAVVSCAQPASRVADGHVITLEGLSPEARALWADSFAVTGAAQCGYCSPGIVMKTHALLEREAAPSRAEIARALAGNLCRCTGYVKIIDAIELVAAARRARSRPEVDRSGGIGSRTVRYRAREFALGERPFVNDLAVPRMLHAALRFSDHPRAVVLRIDTTRAAAHPGVVAVITARDVPGKRHQGLIVDDWPLFVAEGETTRYVGGVLAAMADETRRAARDARRDRVAGARPGHRSLRSPGARRALALRRRQPRLAVGRETRRRRCCAGRGDPRGDRDISHRGDRARVPRAGGVPRRATIRH